MVDWSKDALDQLARDILRGQDTLGRSQTPHYPSTQRALDQQAEARSNMTRDQRLDEFRSNSIRGQMRNMTEQERADYGERLRAKAAYEKKKGYKNPNKPDEIVAPQGSSCFADLRWSGGVATASFYRGGAITYDYPMTRQDFLDWIGGTDGDNSLGEFFNDYVR